MSDIQELTPEAANTVDPIGEIVVTATLRNDGLYAWYMDLDRAYSQQERLLQDRPTENITVIGRRPTNVSTSLPTVFHSSVNISVPESAAHFNQAMKAAENVATALTKVQALLTGLPANQTIHWGNRTMTVSQVLSEISNTKFIINDSNPGNGGNGKAIWGQRTGPNIDYLHYEAFDGDNDVTPMTANGGDYAGAQYTRGEGMVAIMLHEIGHMSEAGHNFTAANQFYYGRENNGNFNNYNRSDYWTNNEAFANDFAYHAAFTMGFDTTNVPVTGTYFWREPNEIYFDKQGYRTPADSLQGNDAAMFDQPISQARYAAPHDMGYNIAIA